jgi:hypothetical protein
MGFGVDPFTGVGDQKRSNDVMTTNIRPPELTFFLRRLVQQPPGGTHCPDQLQSPYLSIQPRFVTASPWQVDLPAR